MSTPPNETELSAEDPLVQDSGEAHEPASVESEGEVTTDTDTQEQEDSTDAEDVDPELPRKDREVQRLKKESAKHRVALRATEEQLTQAQNTITSLQTQMIEEQLAGLLQAPKLFWAIGNKVSDFLTDTGQIDRDKVTEAAQEATTAGLAPARRNKGSANGGYRENGTPPAPTTWAGIR